MQGLTEEQRLFLEMGEAFADDMVAAARMYSSEPGDTWRRLCELGLPAALLPERLNGFDGGAVESYIIGWIQGRGLCDTPLLPSAVTCAALIVACPESELRDGLLSGIAARRRSLGFAHHECAVTPASYDLWLKARLSPSDDQFSVRGEKVCVLGAGHADGFLVSAMLEDDLAIVHVPVTTPGLEIEAQQLIDGRSSARIRLNDVTVAKEQILVHGQAARNAVQQAERATGIALVGDGLGALEKALDLAVDYISTREQFGGPLSRFQVLRHRVADIFMVVREIEALGLRAAQAADGGLADADRMLRSAKIHLGTAGVRAAEQCVQLHGAMGITEEVDVGRCLKRILTADSLFGNARQHLEIAAEQLQ